MRWKGQLTIFVSLLFLAILPVMMLLLQLAQREGAESYFLYAAKSAKENLKASYCREFFEKYGLFLVWENQNSAENQLMSVMEFYEADMDSGRLSWKPMITYGKPTVDIYGYEMATDEMGIYLEKQIVAAEKYNVALDTVFAAFGKVQNYEAGLGMLENIPGLLEQKIETLQPEHTQAQENPSTEMPAEANSPSEKTEEKEVMSLGETISSVSFLELLRQWKDKPMLTLILGTNRISDRVIPFSYGQMAESMEKDSQIAPTEIYDRYLVANYMRKNFGHYRNTSVESVFLELEYILSGKGSDQENLENTLKKFITWKGAINLVSALGNPEMVRQAEELSAVTVGLLGNPALTEGGKLILLAALSYGEAIVDARRVMNGLDVVLLKEPEDWMLCFDNAVEILSSPEACMQRDEKGVGYEEYLQYLLLLQKPDEIRIRMMEVMQWNLQQENPYFLLEHCICGVFYELGASVGKGRFPWDETWQTFFLHDQLQFYS